LDRKEARAGGTIIIIIIIKMMAKSFATSKMREHMFLDVNALAVNVIEWFKIRLWFKLE
jgi:hypothetical protein